MVEMNSKHERAERCRTRMREAMAHSDMSQSALARAAGVDRSTLSQWLKDTGARMPGGHLVADCAAALGVSSDWLLGLSDRPETAAALLRNTLSLTQAPRALVDEQIFAWHREAAGYKVRHVPVGLPDMLKTRATLEWEYGPHLGRTAQQAINASEDRLAWMRGAQSDYEIALPLFEIQSFVKGTGYYQSLPPAARFSQIDRLVDLSETLYPRLRLSLFDARRLYSAPITVFGPLLAVIYTGGHYMAFRDRERVTLFTDDFDRLVREATVPAHGFARHLQALAQL